MYTANKPFTGDSNTRSNVIPLFPQVRHPHKSNSLYTIDGRIKPSAAEPVKDKETIQAVKEYLLNSGKYGYRNYLVYIVGINIGRRVGDLLKLRISDVYDGINAREEITHIEQKTNKRIQFYLNDTVRDSIKEYLSSLSTINMNDPLFKSQKASNFDATKMELENDCWRLNTRSYWKILNDVQKELEEQLNIDIHLSTHTMRKTFGYHKYQEYKNKPLEGGIDVVDMLQDAFGHHTGKQSLAYIGITKENKQRLYTETSL